MGRVGSMKSAAVGGFHELTWSAVV
jgi:hypothetical protein